MLRTTYGPPCHRTRYGLPPGGSLCPKTESAARPCRIWGRPESEIGTPVNIGNGPYRDNGEGVAATPLPYPLRLGTSPVSPVCCPAPRPGIRELQSLLFTNLPPLELPFLSSLCVRMCRRKPALLRAGFRRRFPIHRPIHHLTHPREPLLGAAVPSRPRRRRSPGAPAFQTQFQLSIDPVETIHMRKILIQGIGHPQSNPLKYF